MLVCVCECVCHWYPTEVGRRQSVSETILFQVVWGLTPGGLVSASLTSRADKLQRCKMTSFKGGFDVR